MRIHKRSILTAWHCRLWCSHTSQSGMVDTKKQINMGQNPLIVSVNTNSYTMWELTNVLFTYMCVNIFVRMLVRVHQTSYRLTRQISHLIGMSKMLFQQNLAVSNTPFGCHSGEREQKKHCLKERARVRAVFSTNNDKQVPLWPFELIQLCLVTGEMVLLYKP